MGTIKEIKSSPNCHLGQHNKSGTFKSSGRRTVDLESMYGFPGIVVKTVARLKRPDLQTLKPHFRRLRI